MPWISAASKQAAFDKLDMVARNVGWPQWIMDDAMLANYYKNLNVTADDDAFTGQNKVARADDCARQAGACVQAMRWAAWKKLSTVGQPIDRNRWSRSPVVVNAWYHRTLNLATIPGAIMSAPFYNSSYPRAYNYARSGWVVAHEIGHGFDNHGECRRRRLRMTRRSVDVCVHLKASTSDP